MDKIVNCVLGCTVIWRIDAIEGTTESEIIDELINNPSLINETPENVRNYLNTKKLKKNKLSARYFKGYDRWSITN